MITCISSSFKPEHPSIFPAIFATDLFTNKTRSKKMENNVNFTYNDLPPSRNHEGLTPEQEWAKIADAAERRKIQNRNAQRKYRHNLKRRVEALERQHSLGLFKTPSPATDLSACAAPKTESQSQAIESPTQKQETSGSIEERSVSPERHTIDILDPALGSMQSYDTLSSIEPDWMSHNHFMSAPIPMRSTPLPSPPITASQSPDMCQKSQMEQDNDQALLSSSMMSLSSLDDYISQNNTIIDNMCTSESISSDDLDLSYHHVPLQRPALSRRGTAPDQTLGRTTLHLAAMRGYLQIVHMLLEKGIDINTRDSQGWTALHLAAERGQQEVVKLLLDRGADVYARV